MIADKLTKEIVQDYHVDLTKYLDVDLVTWNDIKEAVALLEAGKTTIEKITGPVEPLMSLLKEFEIFDPFDFVRNTAVTVPIRWTKRTFIYVPWVPGDKESLSFVNQIATLGHEGQHVIQSRKEDDWLRDYLISFTARTRAEKEAFLTLTEIRFLLCEELLNLDQLIRKLNKYFLRPTDEKVLIAALEANRIPVEQGDRVTEIGKWTAAWFKERI